MRLKKQQKLLIDEQWEVLTPLFPEPARRKDGRGRPWVSNRSCLEGILWVLRTGARWRDMPEQYPNGSTCWRRLRMWEEQGIWLAAWRKLLGMLDERRLLDWEEAFLDATFVIAKKGALRSARPVAGKVRSAWWWSTATAYLSECSLRPRRLPNAGLRKARSGM
jgi:transposase